MKNRLGKYTSIGGQALIEGIMMKSPEKTAMAVRKPDGDIDISYIEGKPLKERYKIFGIPLIRGAVAFVESLVGGYKAMMKSAEISGFTDFDEESEKPENIPAEETSEETVPENGEETKEETPEETQTSEKTEEKKDGSKLMIAVTLIGSVLGVLLAVVLFILVPSLAVTGVEKFIINSEFSNVARAALEQVIKLLILVVYVWAVSFMNDIKRVFMYHGAEHKTIFCYEHGKKLTVENVRGERRFHPRCGTSFMILMILVSFFVSILIMWLFEGIYEIKALWVAVKILLIPLVCGLGYEVLKICGKYDNVFTRIIAAPGMWLQHITTKEPEDDMIEIAIAALKACEPETPDVDRSVDEEDEAQDEQNDI